MLLIIFHKFKVIGALSLFLALHGFNQQALRADEKYAKVMLEMDGVMNKKTEMKALPPSTTAGNANEDEDYDKIDQSVLWIIYN